MAFRYAPPRASQHLLLGTLLLVAVVAGTTEPVRSGWAILIGTFDDVTLFVAGSMIVHLLVFWPVAGLFHLVDRTGRPDFVARHQIQDGPRRQPAMGRTLGVVLFNQLVLTPPLLWLTLQALHARGWSADFTLPTLPRLLGELAVMAVAASVVFYAAHRFLHRPWWLRKVHRLHHEYRTTVALAAEYAHPFEYIVGNFGTLAAGVLLIAPHLASIWLFEVLALLHILVHHSGYALPWAPWSVPHDWHHHKVTELFGTTDDLDRWLGTAPGFEKLRKEHDAA